MVFHVGRGGDLHRELDKVRFSSCVFEHTLAAKLLGNGDDVGGSLRSNRTMIALKILRFRSAWKASSSSNLDHLRDRLLLEKHRSEHLLFDLHRLGGIRPSETALSAVRSVLRINPSAMCRRPLSSLCHELIMKLAHRLDILPGRTFPVWISQECRRMVRHHQRVPSY